MTSTLIQVPLARLRHGPNVREQLDEGLVESVRAHGVIQPITVAKEGGWYTVLMGHRRTAAARRLGLTVIPALLEDGPVDGLRLRQLAENLDRKAMDHVDVATALVAELEATPGLTQGELAKRLGKTQGWVSRKILLLNLDAETLQRLSAGEITEQQANAARLASTPLSTTGRPRAIQPAEEGRSRSVVVDFAPAGQATIGVDRDDRQVDVVLQDARGRGVIVALRPEHARLLGRRLLQAGEAVSA